MTTRRMPELANGTGHLVKVRKPFLAKMFTVIQWKAVRGIAN
jgi:hypothetical protein